MEKKRGKRDEEVTRRGETRVSGFVIVTTNSLSRTSCDDPSAASRPPATIASQVEMTPKSTARNGCATKTTKSQKPALE